MRHKKAPHDSRIPDSVCMCGRRGLKDQKSKKKNHVPIPLFFPVLAAQWCPERLASCFPHHHVLLANKEMRGDMELMLGTRN